MTFTEALEHILQHPGDYAKSVDWDMKYIRYDATSELRGGQVFLVTRNKTGVDWHPFVIYGNDAKTEWEIIKPMSLGRIISEEFRKMMNLESREWDQYPAEYRDKCEQIAQTVIHTNKEVKVV